MLNVWRDNVAPSHWDALISLILHAPKSWPSEKHDKNMRSEESIYKLCLYGAIPVFHLVRGNC